MEVKEQEDTLAKLKDLKNDISTLKSRLNELNEQKESWFKKKDDLQKEVQGLIAGIKQIKSEKDGFNKELFEMKDTRDRYNSEVKSLVAEIKKLNNDKKDFLAKNKLSFDPARLKEKIQGLEESIETEAYSFEKEKKIMDEIKRLKKTYDEASKINEIFKKTDDVSKKIEVAKAKADEAHNKFRELSGTNKEGYHAFIEASKSINEKKKEQEAAYRKFLELKKEFGVVNSQLKQKLVELKEMQSTVSGFKEDRKKDRKSKEDKILKEKVKDVEEKLKKKGKLTTEDLIVFQGNKDDSDESG
ncbi:MAG: hypothetical protein V1645_00175 [archaeon]